METIDKVKVEQGDLVQALYSKNVKIETYSPERGIEYLENKDGKIFFRYLGENNTVSIIKNEETDKVRLVEYDDIDHKQIYIAPKTNLVKIDLNIIAVYKQIEKYFGNSIYIHYYSGKDADRILKLCKDNVNIYYVNSGPVEKEMHINIMGYIFPISWIEQLIAGNEVKIESTINTVDFGAVGKMFLIDKNSLSLYQIIRDMSRDMFEDYKMIK